MITLIKKCWNLWIFLFSWSHFTMNNWGAGNNGSAKPYVISEVPSLCLLFILLTFFIKQPLYSVRAIALSPHNFTEVNQSNNNSGDLHFHAVLRKSSVDYLVAPHLFGICVPWVILEPPLNNNKISTNSSRVSFVSFCQINLAIQIPFLVTSKIRLQVKFSVW